MALLGGYYVFVEDEEVARDVKGTSHPAESGLDVTSTIRREPVQISLKGKIVDYGNMSASDVLAKLYELQKKGTLLSYTGRNAQQNLQIHQFTTSHPNTNAGGADFTMTLKEIRIAKSSYTSASASSTSTKTTTAEKKNNPDLSVGAIVVFTGGSVYVSSDAATAASTRGRSTCKITIINTRSWAKHPYHLISTDGKMVYGWVDKANIEGVTSNGTAATTNGGTQQTQKASSTSSGASSSSKIYHVVKKGDNLIDIAAKYNSYGVTAKTIMQNNPGAFMKANDARTLKLGARLFICNK